MADNQCSLELMIQFGEFISSLCRICVHKVWKLFMSLVEFNRWRTYKDSLNRTQYKGANLASRVFNIHKIIKGITKTDNCTGIFLEIWSLRMVRHRRQKWSRYNEKWSRFKFQVSSLFDKASHISNQIKSKEKTH